MTATATQRGSLLWRRSSGSAAVLLGGAVVYAAMEGLMKVRFDVTPLSIGLIAIAAGIVGARPRLIATGLVLVGWGSAVLLVDHGIVDAARTTPTYMLGIGAGLLVAARLAPPRERGEWLTSAAVTAFAGPLGLYLAYDSSSIGQWQAWAIVLVAWAAWELFWSTRGLRPEAIGHASLDGAGAVTRSTGATTQ